jgi:hypothetical protein
MAQGVESLPNKYEALSSNSNTREKEKDSNKEQKSMERRKIRPSWW